jgi:hypothetical protein
MILRFGRHKLLIISASEIEGEVIRERKEAWRRGYKAGWAAKKREPQLFTTDGIPLTIVHGPTIEPLPPHITFDRTPEGNLKVSGLNVIVDNPPDCST